MLKRYQVILPEVQGNFKEEWKQCLEQIKKIKLVDEKVVKLNVFVDMPDYDSYIKASRGIGKSISDAFRNQCPSYNVTVNPPEKPLKVAIEAGFIDTNSCKTESKLWNSIPYIVSETDSEKEVWIGGLGLGMFPEDERKAAKTAFDQMRAILEAEQMTFNHIIRQWNFIGEILHISNGFQNYQIFNEVRSENYHKYRTVHNYPAATGIGMKFCGVTLDCCAVKAKTNVKIIAIDNPEQIRPYDYGQQVLRGNPADGRKVKQPPQFERAVHISNNHSSTLFVSGTASIIGQDTIGVDDVEKQTVVTIENISRLTDKTRIGHLTGNPNPDTGSLIILRVYIKKQEDFPKVKMICEKYFPGITAIYIQADICRDDLLVEIEAEFSKPDNMIL